jgi:protein O-mannosyl-transferase
MRDWSPPRDGEPSLTLVPKPEAPITPGVLSPTPRWMLAVLGVLLVAATIAAYHRVGTLPFIAINDAEYVTQNLRIQQFNWDSVVWSFTTFHAANWHPLTWMSHALDYRLFALDAGRHHEMNLLLHVVNACLLFWILWRATARAGCSFMVAALFALHPINVESVAWIAERKNVLSMFFLLLALGAYRWYASRPSTGRYGVVTALFVLGLMSKPQVITLPLLLLLWDYWPLERRATEWRLLLLEKVPWLFISAASAIITVAAQRTGGAMGGALRSYSLPVRVENAVVSYARYLYNAIWPVRLAFFYPHPARFPLREVGLAALVLLAITALVVSLPGRRYLTVGWLWFLGALVPMIGLLQVGGQAMADRYAYLSFVGLFIAFCWGVADWAQEHHLATPWLAGVSVVLLAALMFATERQLSYWSSDVALWSHTVEVTRNNAAAENILGETLQRAGDRAGAIEHFRAAMAGDPLLPYPHYHVGIYDEQQGDPRAALSEFQQVLALTRTDAGVLAPIRADTLLRMASDYEAIGDAAAAQDCVRRALEEQRKQRRFEAGTSP